MADGGDSGGPVFYDNTAWGLITFHDGGVKGAFMPQSMMGTLGIEVAIN